MCPQSHVLPPHCRILLIYKCVLKSDVPLIQGWQIFIANYQSDTTVHCQELRLAHDEVATHSQCARAQKKKRNDGMQISHTQYQSIDRDVLLHNLQHTQGFK